MNNTIKKKGNDFEVVKTVRALDNKDLKVTHDFVVSGGLNCKNNTQEGITHYLSMEHFVNKIKALANTTEVMYESGEEKHGDDLLNAIIEVTNHAKVFNKHFGL